MNKIIYIIGVLLLNSCCKYKEFKGIYISDKFVVKEAENNSMNYNILEIKENNTFTLSSSVEKENTKITGSFSTECKGDNIFFYFIYENKKIKGRLNGNIFYFSYPNDFHNGKYESIIYVKSAKK